MADMLNAVHERETSSETDTKPVRHLRAVPLRASINLVPTVKSEIIPRLHAALQKSLREPRHPLVVQAVVGPTITSQAVARSEGPADLVHFVADRLLADDPETVRARIDAVLAEGHSLESIYLNLIGPTACHLRDLWIDDICGLADVTLALLALQSLMRHYAPDFYAEAAQRETGMRVLLVSPTQRSSDVGLPTFGLLLMSEFFRREGWDAWVEPDLTSGNFRGAVLGEWFDLVEVLATNDKQLDEISTGIRAIRRGSPNPAIGVIVCGQVFVDHPEFVRLVGADLMASDPLSSLSQAENYVTRPTQRKRLA